MLCSVQHSQSQSDLIPRAIRQFLQASQTAGIKLSTR